jgi:glycine/D-amino acid oxidase-like deaminating enzyme
MTPFYDPFNTAFPEAKQPYPDSYWSSQTQTTTYAQVETQLHTDVAIIGGGYTGLSAAYHLSQNNVDNLVIEANEIGWGASGRNAGFVIPGTGRLSLLQIRDKWGESTSVLANHEFQQAINTTKQLIDTGNIECDMTQGGYLRVAHKPNFLPAFKQQLALQQGLYASTGVFKSGQQIQQGLMNNEHAYGGIYYGDCFGVNPLKLAHGYARLARKAGSRLYTHSPVIQWQQGNNKHLLHTPAGTISCNKVIIATNGYTGTGMHSLLKQRHFPVLSSIIVTRKLTDHERLALGLKPGLLVMDTRALKYYYRLLPDGRLLFGGRGAIKGKDANKAQYARQLLDALKTSFPVLSQITTEYFWSGWVSVAIDDYPRLWADQERSIFYAMGYCGSGLSFATLAGKRLAQKIIGTEPLPALPYYQSELKTFPLAAFRRMGLSIYYKWAKLRG